MYFFVFGLICPVFFHVDKMVFLGYHINRQATCAIGPKKDAKDAKDTRDNLFKGLFNSVYKSA
jgi:hypothetical protein